MIYPLFALGTSEILIIVLIIVLLFGAKKIPELMRGMGRGVKEFKDAVDGKEAPEESSENEPEK